MIKELIEIAIHKKGNKRQLGIALGFPEKYAGQRVEKLIENPNFKMQVFKKLLNAAELDESIENSIYIEYKKIFDK